MIGHAMGKRSSFERAPRDFYPTPLEAVLPLLPHIDNGSHFAEPCAGNAALVGHLMEAGKDLTCIAATDIEPQSDCVQKWDAFDADFSNVECLIITNPPWDRKILHPLIAHFKEQNPTWLLFDADWMHTKQSAPFMPYLRKVVSVGRVKWIPDSKMTGKDNCAWYLFDKRETGPAEFFGRTIVDKVKS